MRAVLSRLRPYIEWISQAPLVVARGPDVTGLLPTTGDSQQEPNMLLVPLTEPTGK